ncbi:MAG TPA: hypothetical protein VGR10_01740 [Thermoleophilaceae bacterium]|nr:hypothetical protein [Thermoleophilaceae bacterium]
MAAPRLRGVEEHDLGLSWVVEEAMERASHALADAGRVWLVDPVDAPEATERAVALGRPAAVLQLLDRHPRDCAALAERLGVPHLRLPPAVPESPFEVLKVVDVPKWREVALWWPGRRALVVAEPVGSGPFYVPGATGAGIHPFLRLRPPGTPRRFGPEHLLFGHGPPLHGEGARTGLEEAYHRSRRDIVPMLVKVPRLVRR